MTRWFRRPRTTGCGRRPARPGGDRGSATIGTLAVGLVLLAAGVAGSTIGAARVAGQQAQAAADLAALAGAAQVGRAGPAGACARAAELAAANQARLTSCRVVALDLTVVVEVTPAPAAARFGRPATAVARAGPIRADDSR